MLIDDCRGESREFLARTAAARSFPVWLTA